MVVEKMSSMMSLQDLGIMSSVIERLNIHGVNSSDDLWRLSRKDLKGLGLSDADIKHISIKLQLHSLDLNHKRYNRN